MKKTPAPLGKRANGTTKPAKRKKLRSSYGTVRNFAKAFVEDDLEKVRKDAGKVVGQLVEKFNQMILQINEEGLTLVCPKTDVQGRLVFVAGDPVYEHRAHPLIEPVLKIARQLKIDLNEFGLTPKSRKGSTDPSLNGRINLTKIDMKVVVMEQQKQLDQFKEQVKVAKTLREADPVFQQFGLANPSSEKQELKKLEEELQALDKRKFGG